MGKKKVEINLVKESCTDIPQKDSVIAKIYNIKEINKDDVFEYKKITLNDKDKIFNFYERLCFKTIYDVNENPIGKEVFSEKELDDAISRIVNTLYLPLHLNLENFNELE